MTMTWSALEPTVAGAVSSVPQGGEYTLGAVGVRPTCSIPGHSLP